MAQTFEKQLVEILPKNSGRDNAGHISVRHQGGRHKRFFRRLDQKRNKTDIKGRVLSVEYDPNRTANIALVQYSDGEKRYIVAPIGLAVGAIIVSGHNVDIKPGNALPLKFIPIGTPIHSVELVPGRGAKMIRAAGTQAMVLAKEGAFVHVKLPSGEIRRIHENATASVGQVSNEEWRNVKLGTAGRARRMGKRPEVRGVAQNPRTHPHGGGEGRSGVGMPSPKSPWGRRTLGKKTRRPGKYSNWSIVQKRK